MDLDGAGNATERVKLHSELIVTTPLVGGWAGGYMSGTDSAHGSAERGVFLPEGGAPVFNLPDGCTCSAPDMGIEDNMILGPVSVDEPESTSWGAVKARYK